MKPEFMAPEVGSLEHYGVKGMRWGKRNTNPDGSKGPGLIRNRNAPDASGVTRKDVRVAVNTLNRDAQRKLEDWSDTRVGKDRTADIKSARKQMKMVNRTYSDAVREIKGKKGEVGRNATKIAMAKASAERYATASIASQKTTGEAIVGALFQGLEIAARA